MDDKVYIKFNDPKGESLRPSGQLRGTVEKALVKILAAVIPKANPNFEHRLEEVDFWKIEYNKTDNTTWREIGFDKEGKPIVAMPHGDNYGFWTDNQLTMDDFRNFDPTPITEDKFNYDWTEFEEKNKK